MKKSVLFFMFIGGYLSASAQFDWIDRNSPTYHDSYADYYIMGGYQYLSHPTGAYNVGTFQVEMLYSFFGTRAGLTLGPDYTSFSVFGLLFFAPKILMESIQGQEAIVALPFMLAAFSAGFLRFPLTDHLEITGGWDALKFTKLRNYSDVFYVTGSLNAGLTYFFNDNFFVNGYYEFNHTHNTLIEIINKIGEGIYPRINTVQPSELKGHSFGFRVGWMF